MFDEHENRDAIPGALLARHQTGDWGEELPTDAAAANEQALAQCGLMTSIYTISGHKVMITTSEDRSLTLVALAEEIIGT